MKVISRRETYGYEISQQLQQYGFSEIAEGTIYPLLLRLEKNGLVNVQYRISPLGPKRKYFTISAEGQCELDNFLSNWEKLRAAVDMLIADKGGYT